MNQLVTVDVFYLPFSFARVLILCPFFSCSRPLRSVIGFFPLTLLAALAPFGTLDLLRVGIYGLTLQYAACALMAVTYKLCFIAFSLAVAAASCLVIVNFVMSSCILPFVFRVASCLLAPPYLACVVHFVKFVRTMFVPIPMLWAFRLAFLHPFILVLFCSCICFLFSAGCLAVALRCLLAMLDVYTPPQADYVVSLLP